MDLKKIGQAMAKGFGSVAQGAKRHAPEIYVTLGIVAGAGAIVTAITGTIKAKKLIDEKKAELGVEKLTAKEIVKTVWKCYISTAGLGIGSAAAIISGSKISLDRTAAMGALYNAGQAAYSEYREAVKEETGEEQAKKIDDRAAAKTVEGRACDNVMFVGDDDIIFLDSLSGRYLKTTKEKIEAARNDFNEALIYQDRLSLNDWYDLIGLEPNDVGDMLFWDIASTKQLRLSYGAALHQNKVPCVVIEYDNPPRYYSEM